MVELTVLGISLQEEGSAPVLLLHPHGTRRILSVRIGPMEAFAISTALHGQVPDRRVPLASGQLTHDLLLRMLETLGGRLRSVDLVDLRQGAFIAHAVIAHGGALLRVECRPSDGVALALRCKAGVRATDAVLAHAESIDVVMAGLPEHVRTLASARLAELSTGGAGDWTRVPLAVEQALAARAAADPASPSPHEELISVARKMLEEDEAARRKAQEGKGPRIAFQPAAIVIGRNADGEDGPERKKPQAPQIRVTMVRHTGKGEAEVLKEFEVPVGGVPREVLTSLGLSRREAEAVNGASEDERWATLLRLLNPETKVPM